MNRPDNPTIAEKINKIKTAAGYKGGWDALDLKLRTANDRDRRGGNAIADGYPGATLGGGGGSSELTSVEAAASSRIERLRSHDDYHRQVERAYEWLDEAARAVGAYVHTMNKLDELDGNKPAMEHCGSCATAKLEELEVDLPLRFGRVGDVLERQAHLCRSCYKFAENHRRLPTVEELKRYRSGKALRPFRDPVS